MASNYIITQVSGALFGFLGVGEEEQSGSSRGASPEGGSIKMEELEAEIPCDDIPENDWVVWQEDKDKVLEEGKQESAMLQKQLDNYKHQFIDQSALLTTLGKEKEDLSRRLAEKDQRTIALRDEANRIVFMNTQLLSENNKLKQGKWSDPGRVQELEEHVKKQSRIIAALRDEMATLESKRSGDICRLQELEDDRDKLEEDFKSARESKTKLKNKSEELVRTIGCLEHELSTTKTEAFQSAQKTAYYVQRLDDERKLFGLSDDPACEEHSLQHEIEVMRDKIDHLWKEKNEAIEKIVLVKAEAEIFKTDFEEERRDRARAQSELEDLRINGGQTKAYQDYLSSLQKEIDETKQERNQLKMKHALVVEKLKCESDGNKEVIFHFKTQIEKLGRVRDSYKEKCAKSKAIEADLVKSKEVVEISKKKIATLTYDMKEEKKLSRKEIKELKKQLGNVMGAHLQQMEDLEKCKKKLKQLVKEKEKAKNSNGKMKSSTASNPVFASTLESKSSKTEMLNSNEIQNLQSLYSEIDMLNDELVATKVINANLKGLLNTAATSFLDAQVVPVTSRNTEGQSVRAVDSPTCQIMPRGMEESSQIFHAKHGELGSTKKVVSGMGLLAAQDRGMTSEGLIHNRPPPHTASEHAQRLPDKSVQIRPPSQLLDKNASVQPSPQPPLTVPGSLARQSSVESRPILDTGHDGNCYEASQGNELLQRSSRRQGEGIHQEPIRAGGDPCLIPPHHRSQRIASYDGMIGPQRQKDRGLHQDPLRAGGDGACPRLSQDGVQHRADCPEMIGQQAERHRDRHMYQQPLRAGGNDVLLLHQNEDKNLLPHSQEPSTFEVMNFPRVQEIRSGEGQMNKIPLRAGGDGGSRTSQDTHWRKSNSSQETNHIADLRPDQQKTEDSEGAKDRMCPLDSEKEKKTDIGTPTLHDLKYQNVSHAILQPTGSGPPAQNDLQSASLDQTNRLSKEEMLEFEESDTNKNVLDHRIDGIIEDMANGLREEISEDRSHMKTMESKPFDPNLNCPICGKVHRIGEIQKFRRHVDICGNT